MIRSLARLSSKLILRHGKWQPIAVLDPSVVRRPRYNQEQQYSIPATPTAVSATIGTDVAARNPAAEEVDVQRKKDESAKLESRVTVLGIPLPIKPRPPAEGECCQSGCARCTLDVYLEDIQHYHEELALARSKILNQNREIAEADWPKELGSRTGGKEEVEKEIAAAVDKLEIDPATRAFMAFEAKMKQKNK